MRIVVIDEEGAVVDELAVLLAAPGAEVVRLTDLWELVALLDSHHFDCLIGDDLAVMLVKELAPATRRALITNSRAAWTRHQLEVLGVELIVEKPLDRPTIQRELKAFIDG